MQNIEEVKLKKYNNIRRFVYDDLTRNAGMFITLSDVSMMLNAILGTLFLIIDVFSVANKLLPISLIILNIIMYIGYELLLKKEDTHSTSYKYCYFLPNLYAGLCGVYSSFVFLYTTNEILYWAMGSCEFVKNYMKLVLIVFTLIVIIQFIWYSIALKKGYYCDRITYESGEVEDKMDLIAKILVVPISMVYIAIAPFSYIFTRMLVHTVDSYPLQIVIFVTLLLALPFMCTFSYPIFIWIFLVWKYRKFIPKTVRSKNPNDYTRQEGTNNGG